MPTLQTKTSANEFDSPLQPHQTHNSNIQDEKGSTSEAIKMPTVLRDVDELVNDIKLNLKLKGSAGATTEGGGNGLLRCCCFEVETCSTTTTTAGGAKTKKSSSYKLSRIKSAPYYVVDKNTAFCNNQLCTKDEQEIHRKSCCCKLHHRRQHFQHRQKTSDDPYELLQELLKEGSLIKEAVRRLNFIAADENKCFDYDQDDYEPSSAVVV